MDQPGLTRWSELQQQLRELVADLNQLIDDLPAGPRLVARSKLRSSSELFGQVLLRIEQVENLIDRRISGLERRLEHPAARL